ncbi:MAG: FAD-dependent oxidoreductase, partial [Gemmatimonadota bacterium]|nr:FAD-dependent oxidoreductase [Gemmatimonadota bacterium]
ALGTRRRLLRPRLGGGGGVSPPPAVTFEDGMQSLPLAMAEELGDRVRLSTAVRSLERGPSGWRIGLEDRVLEADTVVLTPPATVTSRLLASSSPAAAAAIGSLTYNPLAVVHLDAETELRGLGFQVAFTERDLSLRGVTFNNSLFGRPNLYTAYLGGARHPEVADMSRERLSELARREFRRCTGYEARVLAVEHERMPAWDRSWEAVEDLTLPQGLHLAANWRSRPGIPGRLAEARRTARRITGRAAA